MAAVSDFEKSYHPSYWTKRFDHDGLYEHYVKLATQVTEDARTKLQCQLDVPYGPTDRSKYDFYGTDLPNDAPIFLFIHGGYWMEMSKDTAGFPASVLVSQGIKVIATGYDLCPKVKLTDIVAQIKAASELVLKIAKESGSKSVWIGGHSAGAHLAVSLLYDNEWLSRQAKEGRGHLLKGLVLISGIYKLEPLLKTSVNEALRLTDEELRSFSFAGKKPQPIENVKVILAVGECDSPVFVEETKTMAQTLVNSVDALEYVCLRNSVDHFDIVERLTEPDFALTRLILQHAKA